MCRRDEISSVHRIKLGQVLLDQSCAELARIGLVRGAAQRTARRATRAAAAVALALGVLGAGPLAEPAAATTPVFTTDYPNPFGLASVHHDAAPALADIDGDGDLDAFIGNKYGYTMFFQNTGSTAAPAFAAPSTNPFGLAHVGDFAAPAFADIDGDGDLDAFIGTYPGNTIFFQNTGSTAAPAFAAPSTNPFGLAHVGLEATPAFADIDGDGKLDAFIGSWSGNTIFFQNTGSTAAPAFAAPSTNPFGLAWVAGNAAPAFADIDDDGDLDAFIGDNSMSLTIVFFQNTGSTAAPAFAAPSTNPFGLANVSQTGDGKPAFADIDGDGDLDAFIGTESAFPFSGNTLFFPNTGSPAAPAFESFLAPFGLAVVGLGAAPAFADIDGDGKLDAFIGNAYGNTIFCPNTGSTAAPAFAAPSTNPFGLAVVGFGAAPAFADIDGDGDLDAFIGNVSGNTIFFENTGSTAAPAFAAPSTNPFGLANVGNIAAPALADIDGDGDLDAFIGNVSGNTIFFQNTGSTAAPAFAAPSTNPFGLASVGKDAAPAFADIDGDGDLDAFIGYGYGDTIFFQNTGSTAAPAFAAPSTNPFGLANVGSSAKPAFADIDGNGELDAFIGNDYGGAIFFRNSGVLPTATPTATPTDTPAATPTDTPAATPTDTPAATPTDTPTATPTDTAAATPTDTPAATPTYTPTNTPTVTPTQTPTASATALKTSTPTPRRTQTGTPIFTPSKSTCNVVAPERASNGWFLLLPGAALLAMRRRSRRS